MLIYYARPVKGVSSCVDWTEIELGLQCADFRSQTGRTVIYLFDEKNGSVDARKLVATVQSHGTFDSRSLLSANDRLILGFIVVRSPRGGSSMVRQHRHDGVVDPTVAQRSLCDSHGRSHFHPCCLARMEPSFQLLELPPEESARIRFAEVISCYRSSDPRSPENQ